MNVNCSSCIPSFIEEKCRYDTDGHKQQHTDDDQSDDEVDVSRFPFHHGHWYCGSCKKNDELSNHRNCQNKVSDVGDKEVRSKSNYTPSNFIFKIFVPTTVFSHKQANIIDCRVCMHGGS